MTRRQPEIGSALGLTTDEVIARCDERLERLRALREDLISELAKAVDAATDGADVDLVLHLHQATERMLTTWRS